MLAQMRVHGLAPSLPLFLELQVGDDRVETKILYKGSTEVNPIASRSGDLTASRSWIRQVLANLCTAFAGPSRPSPGGTPYRKLGVGSQCRLSLRRQTPGALQCTALSASAGSTHAHKAAHPAHQPRVSAGTASAACAAKRGGRVESAEVECDIALRPARFSRCPSPSRTRTLDRQQFGVPLVKGRRQGLRDCQLFVEIRQPP